MHKTVEKIEAIKQEKLLKLLTRICADLVSYGGSCEMAPLRMNYICNKYGLKESEFIVNPNGVFATAIIADGTVVSAISSIDNIQQNFGKLQRLDKYCRSIIHDLPSVEEIAKEIDRINNVKSLTTLTEYIASVFVGAGFAILFGGNALDSVIAALASLLIVFVGRIIRKYNTNLFFYNTVVCLAAEFLILICAKFLGICKHPESVSLGVIMLLISGLSFTDGLWSMIIKESTIGLYKLNSALIGAMGIVVGVVAPLLLLGNVHIQGLVLNESLIVQVVTTTLACGGFSFLCCIEKKYIPIVALGAGLAWLVYSLTFMLLHSLFLCMAIASFAVTLYSLFFSAKFRLIANITHTVGILPLVPGTNLFYMLYGLTTLNRELAIENGFKLITTCLGICFGFSLARMFVSRKTKYIKMNATKE